MTEAIRDGEGFDPRPAGPCEEAAALAVLADAGELAREDRERLAAHRASCPSCAAEEETLRATAARLGAALRSVAPSRDLAGPVLARIRSGGGAAVPVRARPLSRLPRPWVAFAAGVAAVLVLTVSLGPALSGRWWWPGAGDRPPSVPPENRPFASFVDDTARAGIRFRHHGPSEDIRWMADSVGSGVVASDLDGDGDPDLLFLDSWPVDGPRPEGAGNRLYRNRGDGSFEEAGPGAGVDVPERVCGAVAADLDGDGNRDLVLCGYGRLRVLRNRGDAVFEDVSEAAGFREEPGSWFTCAAAADFDRDGVLDLFVTRYADQEAYRSTLRALGVEAGREGIWRGLPVFAGPEPLAPQGDRLFRGLGGLRFEEVTESALEGLEPSYGFQCVVLDADGDGWLDVYVANDTHPNNLWRNRGGLRFRDEALVAGCAFDADGKAQAGMGVAAGDLEGDGFPDLLVTNFSNDHLTLYAAAGSPGRPVYHDRSYPSGVGPASYSHLGWGTVFADFDLDGIEDLLVANGHLYPTVAERPDLGVSFADRLQLFAGLGSGRFADRSFTADRGLGTARVHRGLAAADFDGDGRIDLVASVLGGPPVVLRNATDRKGRSWIGFRLRGTRSPLDPAGARVTVTAGGRTLSRALHLGDSFASTSEPVLRFGLGDAPGIARAVVRWPSGAVQELPPLPANRVHVLVEPR